MPKLTGTYGHKFWQMLFYNRFEQLRDDAAYDDSPNSKWSFKEHYHLHVLPHVRNFEDKRVTALRRFKERMYIAVPVWFALMGLVAYWVYITGTIEEGHMYIVMFGTLGLHWWGTKPLRKYKENVKNKIFPNIFNFFGKEYSFSAVCPISISSLEKSQLIPHYTSASKEDYVKGTYKGVGLELFEAHLQRKSGSGKNRRNVTVFKGIFLTLTMNKRFKGQTYVEKNKIDAFNWLRNKTNKKGFSQVTLEDPEFEKQFDVQSTDQVEARYLLTTSFMERLNKLSHVIGAKHIECSFYDNQVLFKISSHKNRFEVHDIYQPATFKDDIHHILEEMNIIFEMIEHLKLHEQTRL